MKKTLIALMALASVACGAITITEDTTMTAAGDLYAPAFNFTFELTEDWAVTGNYDILLAYYQVTGNTNGGWTVNAFELSNTGALTLVRGNSLSSGTGELNNASTLAMQNESTFKGTDGSAYTLTTPGIYTVQYLGGKNGEAAADLYFDGNKVASFAAGNHNMTGYTGSASTDLFVKANGSYVIPEPATATLSLLALAGLCARRRRA